VIPFSLRALSLAVAVALVFGASGWLGYDLGRAAGDRQTLKMMRAGEAAVAARDLLIKTTLEKAREDLAAANARPPKRVYCRTLGGLPKASGGAAGAGAAVADQHDYGPDLRAARDALIRCNTLIGVVK
jgi:hypothetical protein